MDLLILIGSTSAFFYSLAGILMQNPAMLFFETSAMIITLVLTGNFIEQRTVKKTQSAIEALKQLQVSNAQLVHKNGSIETVPLNSVKSDDILIVNEGDTFPTDAIILEGECYVDESMISGESALQFKTINDEVIGATIAANGSVRVQVTRTGKDTILWRMIELVKKAQQERPPIQRLADKISGIFVPVVISISILTFLLAYFIFGIGLTQSLLNSIAVLVISCPCAMGLATPTAISAGVGRMSREGILIKSGRILEFFAKTEHLIFDKTGTLTSGDFKISPLKTFQDIKEEEAIAIILELEKHSSHPIAKSIKKHFRNQQYDTTPEFKSIHEIRGKGVEATDIEGKHYFLGSSLHDSNKKKHINLFRDNVLVAEFSLNDELRPNTIEAIKDLKEEKVKISILSGDAQVYVDEIATYLSIKNSYAGKSPEEKYRIIEDNNKISQVAMVGDGINDAAALSKASIGISLSKASNIAINAADIVLMHQDLGLIPKALKISKETLLTIKQNLFWAFSYNLIAIPLAAFGYLNPMWAALFMTFSDIMVIGNSIRLNYKKIR